MGSSPTPIGFSSAALRQDAQDTAQPFVPVTSSTCRLQLLGPLGSASPPQHTTRAHVQNPTPMCLCALCAGEMSATLMRFTSQWAQLVPTIRSIIGDKHADVKVGIGLNFNKLESTEALMAAKSDTDAGYWIGSGQRAAPTEPMPAADGQQGVLAAAAVPPIDSASVKHLLTHIVDFIGVSAYAPYTGPNFRLHELENSAFNCGDSLRRLADGVELADLVRAGKLELHYSEFGLGGGSAGNQKVGSCCTYAYVYIRTCVHAQTKLESVGITQQQAY